MAFTRLAFLFAITLARAAGADEAPEPGCLLQNQFVNDKFQSSGEDTASQSFLQAKESSRSELSVLESARRVSTERRQQYRAHVDDLRRTLAVLNGSLSMSHSSFYDLSLLQATAACPDVKLPGESTVKLSLKRGKSTACEDDFGPNWATASTAQAYEWCGCEMGTYCKCESKLKPLKFVTWAIIRLTDGQALGPGYKHEVKPTAAGEGDKDGIHLCYECPAIITTTTTTTPAPTPAPTTAPAAESNPVDDMSDIGAGCCLNRDPATMLFKGFTDGLDACKAKLASIEDGGFIEYGWKGNKADGTTNWCTVISKDTDCSELADGPKDCGGGGGDNGVHTYMSLTSIEEQCKSGSMPANKYVQHGWENIPGLKAPGTAVKDIFVTHGGIVNGAYVNGGGKPPEVVRRKKGTTNQWFVGVFDDKYAKIVELTFHISGEDVQVHQSGARYKQMSKEDALTAFSSTDSLLTLYNTASGQHRAHCDGCAGYGIKGLKVKACLASESAVKAGADMGELVENFIDGQSGAEDACHSQLLEARHQLNQLHQLVLDLAQEVNSTEEQIMVYDKMLEEKLREMSQLTKWKDAELDKCETARQKAIEMFAKLKGELDEMHSIANPSVAMDVKTGKLTAVSLAQEVSINQHRTFTVDSTGEEELSGRHLSTAHLHPSHHQKAAHVQPSSSLDKQSADTTMMSGLIAETRKASEAYKACIGPDNSQISLVLLSESKPKTNEECEAERDALEKTYVKAYVELSRMKAEYEELANSTSCFDAVNEQYNTRHPPLQEAADKLSSQINYKVKELQELRPRLDGAKDSETALRAQVTKLTGQCKNVGATVSDLDKVRDAIQSLSDCPGLSRVKFSMPKWIGTWATFDQDASAQDDAEQDSLMNAACSKIKAGSRAAEVGEIQEQTVEGIPTSNDASNSLIGACPDCAGAEDDSFQSGHGRVCWNAGAELTLGGRSENCGAGKKAILCVEDRPDVRVIPGGKL